MDLNESGSPQITVSAPSAEEVRLHLSHVLASPAFRSSRRCARFLDFVVKQALEGRADTIKERTLAVEVFDRNPSWEPSDDTIVRVGAREVRKRLAQCYAAPDAPRDRIRFDLPLGSYVPEFVRTGAAAPVLPVPAYTPVTATSARPRRARRGWLALLAFAIVLLACCIWIAAERASQRTSAFETFWAPFLHASDPVIIAVAHPIVYRPSGHAYSLNQAPGGPDESSMVPLHVKPELLNGSDFIPEQDQFLAYGDAVAAADVQSLLASHGRESHIRFASKVEFADLRETPAIMVGAFSNRWTMELTSKLRYHFAYDSHWVGAIFDTSQPNRHFQGDPKQDYFLICHLLNSPSGQPMIVGAGISENGTEAAGRFLVNAKAVNADLRGLRPDWQNHNVELVLRTRLIANSPSAPELVASYVW